MESTCGSDSSFLQSVVAVGDYFFKLLVQNAQVANVEL